MKRVAWTLALLLGATLLLPPALGGGRAAFAAERCTRCHQEEPRFSAFHSPTQLGCTRCHGGDPGALSLPGAHAGLEAYPGRSATAARFCGGVNCHDDQVRLLEPSIMSTMNGVVELTRGALGVPPDAATAGRGLPLAQRLAEQGVDSYLRKLCASCHLGNERGHHGQQQTDRGGGCSACHLQVHTVPAAGAAPGAGTAPAANPAPAGPTPRMGPPQGPPLPPPSPAERRTGIHPTLRVTVPTERCFGCHSRSGRVSLNYVGLAEVDAVDPERPQAFGHLPDGRLVERLSPDLHAEAGLSCTDCHTAAEVMGTGEPVTRARQQLDVSCEDCHAARLAERTLPTLERRDLLYPGLTGWLNPELARGTTVVTARRGSPLWHVWRDGARRLLRKKAFGTEVVIPVARPGPHHDRAGHERLTCNACHDTWAPQCDGCHIAYDPAGRQWDHLRREETPGRWIERRWHVRHEAPALGVTAENRIAPFVPGMSTVADMPGQSEPLRQVRYARLVPHTTRAKGRDCASCHRSAQALGVITGQAAAPWDPALRLPIGWVEATAEAPAPALHAGDRSLNGAERRRVQRVGACLECHPGVSRIYDDFRAAEAAIRAERPHPRPGTTRPAP